MKQLIISAAAVSEAGFDIDTTLSMADFDRPEKGGVSLESVRVQGLMLDSGGEYLFSGQLTLVYLRACDRCLTPARTEIKQEVNWLFEEGPAGTFVVATLDDELADTPQEGVLDRRKFRSGEIDLTPCVWEEIVLATPYKFLCGKDCKGLCPKCGTNLNDSPCGCCSKETTSEASQNSGLADLARLFPDLAPKNLKE